MERGSAVHGVLGLELIHINSQNSLGTSVKRERERERRDAISNVIKAHLTLMEI